MNKQKGFTLIELLVVIAIIGILASVVLASLNSARAKGADAAVKSSLNNMRAQAELFYDNQTVNQYTGMCADTTIVNALNAAKSASGATATNNTTWGTTGAAATVTCHATTSSWAIEAPLKTGTGGATGVYCVDSSGNAVASTTANFLLGANDGSCT